MAEISLQDIYLGYNKLSKVHFEAQLSRASGLELLKYSWSYILVFIFLTDQTSKKDFSEVWFLCYSGTKGRTWAPQELCWNNLEQHFFPKLLVHLQALHCNSPGAHRYRCDYEGTKVTFSCFISHTQSCAGGEES